MKEAIWIIAAVIALGMGAVAGHEADALADQQESEAIASRDWAARTVCNGRPFEWHGDVLVCFKELP